MRFSLSSLQATPFYGLLVICWQCGSFLILHHKRLTKGLKQTHVGVIGVVAPSRHDNKAVADHIFHDHNVLSFHNHRHHQIHHSNNLQQPLCLHFPPSALFPHTLFPHSLAFKWPHVHIQSKANVNASVATSVVFLFGCQMQGQLFGVCMMVWNV
jgi:hypothetical protein